MFPYPTIPNHFYQICETGGCAEFSRLLQDTINTVVDPCNNFYSFVCSGWDSKHNESVQRTHRRRYMAALASAAHSGVVAAGSGGAPQTLTQKAAVLFRSCEDVALRKRDDTGPFRNLLAEGGMTWPQATPKAASTSRGFLQALAYCHRSVGLNPVLTLNLVDHTVIALHTSAVVTEWVHTRREWFVRETYPTILKNVCEHFVDQRSSCGTELKRFMDIDDIVTRALTVTYKSDESPPLNRRQFDSQGSALPSDAWTRFFSDHLNVTDAQLRSPSTRFILKDPAFFREINAAVASVGENSMVLFVAWTVIFNLGPLFSADLSSMIEGAPGSTQGSGGAESRCLIFMERAQEDIRRITKNIDYPLNLSLTKFVTSNNATANFSKFPFRKGLFGSSTLFNATSTAERDLWHALPEMGDSLLTNYRRTVAFMRTQRPAGCYVRQLDRANYYRFYDSACRSVVVSPIAAALPIYDEQTSSGLRYGAIGSLVAEALFEEFYKSRAPLPPRAKARLKSAKECIERSNFKDLSQLVLRTQRKQGYSATEQHGINAFFLPFLYHLFFNRTHTVAPKVDPLLNTEEAFLLYGGHLAAWSGYRSEVYLNDRRLPGMETYSEDMLFFIAFCYIQCGGSARARDTVCNLPLKISAYFSDTFSCPSGSPMNLGSRCSFLGS
ncbi:hypothetical protein HPB48_013472 [Haemaphysalis longicornis]|uniref:Peptidase M13 N-terminal domain-containing protein n=1 Tax=Haemaphysalis longicornis TaxID=44386 RepID=A0A9J6FZT9_HAELO|nr:hypothetical protein HPB48_013472 [Haemaphysalis longicornis]